MMKRFLKTLRWIAIVAGGLIAILLLVAAVWCWISARRLEKRLEAVRSAGDPLSLAELAREPIPPENNAAVFLRRAQDDLEALDKELYEVYDSETYRSGRPTDAELKTIRSALEAYPGVMPLLERAAACPDYDSQLDYTVAPPLFLDAAVKRVHKLRSVPRVLRARALLLESQGKLDEALEDCILILRLSRHFDREPMIISYLVATACRGIGLDAANRVLRAGPVAKTSRESLDAELALHESMEGFRWAMKSERAFAMESYRAIPARNWWPIRAKWDNDQCAFLDLIDQHLALASKPYSEAVAADLGTPQGGWNVLAELAKPSLMAARAAGDRVKATVRCLRVLGALQALDGEAAVPEPKLSELGLPAEAITDPFNGQPLKLKRLPKGWLVYSVGKNLVDDGGTLDEHHDVGVGPP
jgi:hypothetical protein